MNNLVLSKQRVDVCQSITDTIVRAIEASAGPFVMPWHSQGVGVERPMNAATGLAYRGVNVVALSAQSVSTGYGSGYSASYQQWQKLGAQVRRGEHGAQIVFFKELDPHQEPNEDDDEAVRRLVARSSYVFNASQVDGWEAPAPMTASAVEVIAEVETFVKGIGAVVREGGTVACYRLRQGVFLMPDRARFHGTPTSTPTVAFYATLLHEACPLDGSSPSARPNLWCAIRRRGLCG